MKEDIEQTLLESSEIIKNSVSLSESIEKAIQIIVNCLKNNKKIVIFGNGGSAADSQHIAAEMIGRFLLERKSIPAISLTTDSSILTSLGNDYSYDVIFSRQCESIVNSGDVIIGISTSGNSKNVENGIIASKKIGATTIGLLGNNGGTIQNLVDLSITVNSSSTPRIQEAHRTIYHIICEHVEKLFIKYNET